ncbi:MAG: hypothetical protein RLY70_2048, partial [Planctomycetota bacterium]
MLAGGDVELPAMPGAGQNTAVKAAFAKRAALMRADAIQGVEFAIHRVEHGNHAVLGNQFAGRADRAFVERREANPTSHGEPSSGGAGSPNGSASHGSARRRPRSSGRRTFHRDRG